MDLPIPKGYRSRNVEDQRQRAMPPDPAALRTPQLEGSPWWNLAESLTDDPALVEVVSDDYPVSMPVPYGINELLVNRLNLDQRQASPPASAEEAALEMALRDGMLKRLSTR